MTQTTIEERTQPKEELLWSLVNKIDLLRLKTYYPLAITFIGYPLGLSTCHQILENTEIRYIESHQGPISREDYRKHKLSPESKKVLLESGLESAPVLPIGTGLSYMLHRATRQQREELKKQWKETK